MRAYTVTDAQEEKFKTWVVEHQKTCKLRPGTIGDLFQWHFSPTGIGDFVSAHCACGVKCDDLNDYASF